MTYHFNSRKGYKLVIVFWMLVMFFVVVVSIIFIPVFRGYLSGAFMLIFGIILILLGGSLVFLTLKQKVESKLKKFLILTGASTAGFFIFVFLHNLFYGIGMVTGNIIILKELVKILELFFFLMAIFVCPVAFLVGVIGCIANRISSLNK